MAENTETKTNATQEPRSSEEKKARTETENLFHKMYLFGLGVQKDIEETVNNLIEKGEAKAEQRDKIVDDFVKRAKEGSTAIEKKIEEFVNQTLETMNLVTKEKHDVLKEKCDTLEAKYETLETKYKTLEKQVQELEDQIKEHHPRKKS